MRIVADYWPDKTNSAMKKALALIVALAGLLALTARADEPPAPKRLLLLGQGPDGHPHATHEYFAGLKIVKRCLDRVQGLDAVLVEADEPFRAGPDLIDKTDGVVLFLAEGAMWIQQDETRLAALERLAARGGALAGLHWGTGCRDARYIEKYVNLFGACHGGPDRKYAVVAAATEIAAGKHPIMTGVVSVTLEDEFYYRLKFAKPADSIVPLLRVPIEGEPQTVAWAWERPDQGRSFGFTGLHFHGNWGQPVYRRLVAQGIVWTLKLPFPAAGLDIEIAEEDLKLPDR
jgi:hypothetical protein